VAPEVIVRDEVGSDTAPDALMVIAVRLSLTINTKSPSVLASTE
jgi:hypothetical protein